MECLGAAPSYQIRRVQTRVRKLLKSSLNTSRYPFPAIGAGVRAAEAGAEEKASATSATPRRTRGSRLTGAPTIAAPMDAVRPVSRILPELLQIPSTPFKGGDTDLCRGAKTVL